MTLKLGQTGANGSNVMVGRSPTLDTEGRIAVAFHMTQDPISGEVSPALSANALVGVIAPEKDAAAACTVDPLNTDGRRYAACGNGVAAPVAEWIARRLASTASGDPVARETTPPSPPSEQDERTP